MEKFDSSFICLVQFGSLVSDLALSHPQLRMRKIAFVKFRLYLWLVGNLLLLRSSGHTSYGHG